MSGTIMHGGTKVRWSPDFDKWQPVPPAQITSFHYNDKYTLSTGVAGIFGTEQVWRLNSLFDPDFSGVGHQPYGYDVQSNNYKKYMVYSVKVRFTVFHPTEDGVIVAWCASNSQDTVQIGGFTPTVVCERPNVGYFIMDDDGDNKQTTVEINFDLAGIEGMGRREYLADEDDHGALWTANPASLISFRLAAASSNDSENVTVRVRMDMWFTAKIWGRQINPVS